MELKDIFHMTAGNGETSYANNSGFQKAAISKTWCLVDEALKGMLSNKNGIPKCITMADLGCSSGPNTLLLVSHVADTIEDLCKNDNAKNLPEFEVYLNDLPENDFNNLFKLLTKYGPNNGKERTLECFVYGVPGSFYGRLFPSNSLNFAYSSNSLHWLSQVPDGLGTTNKENISMVFESPLQVFEAYTEQFQSDFSRFLRLRAEEITSGGRMVLAFVGRSSRIPDPSTKKEYILFSTLVEVLLDMVDQGLVKKDDLYSFNIPIHAPCLQEIEEIILDEGSFNLDKMEVVRVSMEPTTDNNSKVFNTYERGKFVVGVVRSFMEPLLASHFGSSMVDGVFDRYAKKMVKHLSKSDERLLVFTPIILLTRKMKH